MHRSKHAEIRFNQRGIRDDDLRLILKYGECRSDAHGCAIYLMDNKATEKVVSDLKDKIKSLEGKKQANWQEEIRRCRKIIQRCDKLCGKTMIVNEEGNFEIITGYQAKPKKIKWLCRDGREKGYQR